MAISINYGGETYGEDRVVRLAVDMHQSLPIGALTVDNGEAEIESDIPLSLDQEAEMEYFRGGSLIFSGYATEAHTAGDDFGRLSFMSPLGKLTQMAHRGGIYVEKPAGELIREICGDVSVAVDQVFEDIPVYGWLPYVTPKGDGGARTGSARDNLMQVLFAIGGNLRATNDGGLTVANLPITVCSIIDKNRLWMDETSITTEPPVSSINVLEHHYTLDQSASARELTLFEGVSMDGQLVIFGEPMGNLHAYADDTEVQPLDSSANFAVLPAGVTSLVGTPYTHTTVEVSRVVSDSYERVIGTDYVLTPNGLYLPKYITSGTVYRLTRIDDFGTWFFRAPSSGYANTKSVAFSKRGNEFVSGEIVLQIAPDETYTTISLFRNFSGVWTDFAAPSKREITRVPAYGAFPLTTPNEIAITDATLVGLTNSADVAQRLADYYRHRRTIHFVFDHGFEFPGDVVSIADPFARQRTISACIKELTIEESAIPKATAEALIDYVPYQITPFEDVFEILSSVPTWTVPAGVTHLEGFVIGGGQGGRAGQPGADAHVPTPNQSVNITTTGTTYTLGLLSRDCYGGDGGEAGLPGAGGKVFHFKIAVTPGDTFEVSYGVGGDGAEAGTDEDGAEGTDTSFGDYSSAMGESNERGFVDPRNGTAYGATGLAGVPGGKGSWLVEDGTEYVEYTPPPIVVDGIEYVAGARNTGNGQASGGSYLTGDGYTEGRWKGGFGGGNAYGANGNDGLLGAVASRGREVTAAPGGDGADALPPPDALTYGQGGAGGNGGGGGGAFGTPCLATNTVSKSLSARANLRINVDTRYNPVAKGGAGSRGGKGAPGCVFLIYRRPVENG